MQTFLPLPLFADTARCLDMKRLGKQRVEAKQILLALGVQVGDNKLPTSWRNHPAVLMWKGYERLLCYYGFVMCSEWIKRKYKDTLLMQFVKAENILEDSGAENISPPWLGNESFHASHRSNLIRKNPDHYGQFGWVESNDLPYVWPTKEMI